MNKLVALVVSLSIVSMLVSLAISVASVWVYVIGVIFGFSHSILLGLVSLIPFVGFVEGLLHLLGVI